MKTQPRTCREAKAYWQADLSTAMDVVIRLSDNDRYDSPKFIREVIKALKPWGDPARGKHRADIDDWLKRFDEVQKRTAKSKLQLP